MVKVKKDTLKKELKYRIETIEQSLKELKSDEVSKYVKPIFKYELEVYKNVLKMVKHFERVEFGCKIEKEKYTPYKCAKTGTPLLIGDKCASVEYGRQKSCGTLEFDSFLNKYVLKSESRHNIHFHSLEKIDDFF